MRSISRLFSAFGTLADSVLSLASVIDGATARLRLQIAAETEPAVIEHRPQGDDVGSTDPLPSSNSTARRGRK
ncbi:MAG TPA: hypothetical protein VMG10_34030 [Gemmataceae bacterium]|nr:hypothetical protein [Gemmataceae bacterium]